MQRDFLQNNWSVATLGRHHRRFVIHCIYYDTLLVHSTTIRIRGTGTTTIGYRAGNESEA